jgi:hypothetical protein
MAVDCPFKVSEKDIQKAILEYLQIKGYVCWRNNTGAMSGSHNGKKWFMHFGAVGSGDILGMTKEGKFFSIEVKAKGKKPSPSQVDFIQRVTLSKGIAFVAYSVDDVQTFL